MSRLEQWLPFKFKKKTQQEKRGESPSDSHQSRALAHQGAEAFPFGSLLGPQMQQFVQQFFDDPFFRDPWGQFGRLDHWFGDFSPRRYSPCVEIADDGNAIKVSAELPGMDKDDVSLHIDDGVLTISGEKKNEAESQEDGVFRTERYYGYFQRSVPLPEDVDFDKAEAEFKNGVLTVRIPKLETAGKKGRKIPVKG